MNRLSSGELKALSEFFNTIAAGWFSGGVIAPFFTPVPLLKKLLFFAAGAILSYWFLQFSLLFARRAK